MVKRNLSSQRLFPKCPGGLRLGYAELRPLCSEQGYFRRALPCARPLPCSWASGCSCSLAQMVLVRARQEPRSRWRA